MTLFNNSSSDQEPKAEYGGLKHALTTCKDFKIIKFEVDISPSESKWNK